MDNGNVSEDATDRLFDGFVQKESILSIKNQII